MSLVENHAIVIDVSLLMRNLVLLVRCMGLIFVNYRNKDGARTTTGYNHGTKSQGQSNYTSHLK